MPKIAQYLFQAAAYALFCLPIWYLSSEPPYTYLQPDQAEVRLAFNHAGQPLEACHDRSRAELDKLPPNMRKARVCGRERFPLEVQIAVDGQEIYRRVFTPPGLHKDGAVFVHDKFPIASGDRRFLIRMKESPRAEDVPLVYETTIPAKPGRTLLVGFDPVKRNFTIQ
ncbi:MAG: hypothetical protein HQL51_11480 [Magnetococcales bacterium]|nr:hypothetical protein [Magnetococcales bacterium]